MTYRSQREILADREIIRAAAASRRAAGESPVEIARALGVNLTTIYRWSSAPDARAEANRKRAAETPPPPWLEAAEKMLAEGASRNEIAVTLRIPASTVYKWLRK